MESSRLCRRVLFAIAVTDIPLGPGEIWLYSLCVEKGAPTVADDGTALSLIGNTS